MSRRLKLTRKVPMDFEAIARETGIRSGKVCRSEMFGWGVYANDEPYFASIDPPPMEPGETDVRIEDNAWCFYAADEQAQGSGGYGGSRDDKGDHVGLGVPLRVVRGGPVPGGRGAGG